MLVVCRRKLAVVLRWFSGVKIHDARLKVDKAFMTSPVNTARSIIQRLMRAKLSRIHAHEDLCKYLFVAENFLKL